MSNKKFTAYEISEEFYNLFFDDHKRMNVLDYLDNSYCDEGFSIDVVNDKIDVFYHVTNKYAASQSDGSFSSCQEFVRDYIVHPDDAHIYDDLLNLNGMVEKLENAKFKGFRFGHLRVKLMDGSYRWTEHVVVYGEHLGLPKNIAKCYVFDIHNTKLRENGEVADEKYVFEKYHDENTGLLRNNIFFNEAQKIIDKAPEEKWCLACIDIENFKLFDQWYGRTTGDLLLKKIAMELIEFTEKNSGLAGYLGQDDFVVLTKFFTLKIDELYETVRQTIIDAGFSLGFMPAIGVYKLTEGETLLSCLDKASIATAKAKKSNKKHIYVYNPQIHLESEKEYSLLQDFMTALKNDEITFYLQPLCRISTKKIVGAEALARWVKKDGEIISPAVFVPILEKYGFITDMDQIIWDKVCSWIRHCLDERLNIVPISVNISQIDIFTIDIAEHFSMLVKKHNIPPELIKLEITESAYVETTTVISNLVSKLRSLGFKVLMDDFGSGYSSLNMLSNLEVDTIKLDSQFMSVSETDKGIHIIESIINMTKIIGIPLVVEGVESAKQLEWLVDLGVRYVQGFYFFKPMPIYMFESMLANEENLDHRGILLKKNEQFRIREFLDKNVYSDAMLNNIIGAVAYYSLLDGNLDIIRYNQQFYESVGVPDFAERIDKIQRWVPEEERPTLFKTLEEAKDNKLNGAKCITHFARSDGTLMAYMMHFYYLGLKDGKDLYYGSAQNITELMDLQEQMSLIEHWSRDTIIFVKKISDKWSFKVGSNGLGEYLGISKDKLSRSLNNLKMSDFFSEKEYQKLREIVYDSLNNKKSNSLSFSMKNKKGQDIHLILRIDPVEKNISNVEFIATIRRYSY